jgi:multiple sugar transport system substrate-binding protein
LLLEKYHTRQREVAWGGWGRTTPMINPTRRSVLGRSAGLLAAGSLARPFIANAAATTATVWWAQGLVVEEDDAFRAAVAAYQKASGNKIEETITPAQPLNRKFIAAITAGGGLPDLMFSVPPETVPLQGWEDRLVDVTDVVETQKSQYLPSALASAYCYNNANKRRSYYGVPFCSAAVPFHVWGSLVEKAGYKIADIPNTWTKFLDFFRPIQPKLQAQGMRHTYSYGWQVGTASGVDSIVTFDAFMIAYGGIGLVTEDGKLHTDDPQVKEAVIKALDRLVADFTQGYESQSAVNWNGADDNNAFHSQLCVIDFDGSLSTEVAMLKKDKDAYYHGVITRGLPLSDDSKPIPAQLLVNSMMIAKGAKNVAVAKDFAKFFIQPEIVGKFIKAGLGRWLPAMPSLVLNDPWWNDPKIDPHRPPYAKEGLVDPTVPFFYVYNPASAAVDTAHVFQRAWADIVNNHVKTADAAEVAFRRIEAIFAKYPIQSA